MYQVIDKHANEILLFLSIPPPPPPSARKPPRSQQTHSEAVDQSDASSGTTTTTGKQAPDYDCNKCVCCDCLVFVKDEVSRDGQPADSAMEVEAAPQGESDTL